MTERIRLDELPKREISVHLVNMLFVNGIEYLDQLTETTPMKIIGMRHIGKILFNQIRMFLYKRGLSLKGDEFCPKKRMLKQRENHISDVCKGIISLKNSILRLEKKVEMINKMELQE